MSVTEKVKREVYERDHEACALCYSMIELERTPHHCYFKSKYHGRDKNEAWNLVTICIDCHTGIHHAGTPKGRTNRRKCEAIAYSRATPATKAKLKTLTPDICEDST